MKRLRPATFAFLLLSGAIALPGLSTPAQGQPSCKIPPPLQPETCACPRIYAPVCGCDGMTYGNACGAGVAGVAIDHTGECAAKGDTCGGFAAFTCDGADEFCDYPAAAACGAADGRATTC